MKTLIQGSGLLYDALEGLKNPYVDVLNKGALAFLVRTKAITEIWFLPDSSNDRDAWSQNTEGLCNVLEIAAAQKLKKVFWLSSLQESHIEPTTVFGISKRAGEYWCHHYRNEFGLDVRYLRLPQLVSDRSNTFINHLLIADSCYLKEDTSQHFIYQADAIQAITDLMKSEHASGYYDVSSFRAAPCDVAAILEKKIRYQPDHRQALTNLWPVQIDDSPARKNWGWRPRYDLRTMLNELMVTA